MRGANAQQARKGAQGPCIPEWMSILVRTGNFRGPGNDLCDPATWVVDDIDAALQLVLEQEQEQERRQASAL